jgi:5'(3')-deoxyribonucleotidase
MGSVVRFDLNQDERIHRVQVKTIAMKFIIDSNNSYTTEIIKDFKFFTNKGRSIPSDNFVVGDVYTEQFDGYTLGYATGRTSQCIDQLQFFWYRTI